MNSCTRIRLRSHFEPARDSLGLGLNPCPLVEPVPVPPAFDLDPDTGPDTGCQLFGGSGDRGYNGGRGEEGRCIFGGWCVFLFLALVTILPFTIDETAVVRSSHQKRYTRVTGTHQIQGFFLVRPENNPSCVCWALGGVRGKRHRVRFVDAGRSAVAAQSRRLSRASNPKRTRLLYCQ